MNDKSTRPGPARSMQMTFLENAIVRESDAREASSSASICANFETSSEGLSTAACARRSISSTSSLRSRRGPNLTSLTSNSFLPAESYSQRMEICALQGTEASVRFILTSVGARVVVPSELGTGTYTFGMSQESMPLDTATYLSDALYETGLSCALVADDGHVWQIDDSMASVVIMMSGAWNQC